MSEIKRYHRYEPTYDTMAGGYLEAGGMDESPDGLWLSFSDHEADVAAKVAKAVVKERERCRREEVELAIKAAGWLALAVNADTVSEQIEHTKKGCDLLAAIEQAQKELK